MAHAKDKHYWTQLRSTVTAGSWDASFPAKAPNGSTLSWSELLRKFNKHCTGYADVAELVSQTQAISLLLAANAQDLDGDDTRQPNTLTLEDECVLPEERMDEGLSGYNVLKGLQSSNSEPVKLALALYAYGLGRPAETVELLDEIQDLENIKTRVAAYGTMRADPLILQVPAAGADSTSSSRTGSMVSGMTTASAEPDDTADGRMWAVTECVRSMALKGMAYEKLSPSDSQKAFSVYQSALPILDMITAEVQGSLTTSPAQNISEVRSSSAFSSFARYCELWRWAERLLRRAIILAATTNDVTSDDGSSGLFWKLLSMYRACSVHWPASFRPRHRSTVATLHLRTFVLRAQRLQPDVLKAKAPRWISAARSIVQEFRMLLSVCTQFPRAGERNVRVEDFVDLCVAVWEADGAAGENAEWVIDCMWWATRLTFNSFRIYRHMSHLLAVSGDSELARRTLRLYMQVVSKAREASSPEPNAKLEITTGVAMETDQQWVEALVQGSRTLCRMALQEQEYGKAVEIAKEAGDVLQKAKNRLDQDDKELLASVQLAEGIWHSVMAHAEQDPRTRTIQLAESLTSFFAAVGTYPTPSAHHHLALALSRPGPSKDMQAAMEHARAAVEGDANEMRHWHLLGLLLAATGDWKAAKGVLEIGISLAEADLAEDDYVAPEANGMSGSLSIRDFGRRNIPNGTTNHPGTVNGNSTVEQVNGHMEPTATVPQDATIIPPSAYLLPSMRDRPPPTRQESFEYALQMRMTQLALTEFVEGAEGIGEKWLEVFHWFREQRPTSIDDGRKSIDSRRVSQDTPRHSDTASVRTQQPLAPRAVASATSPDVSVSEHDEDLTPIPISIPITITPASPGVPPAEYDRSPTIHQADGTYEKRSSSLDEKDRDISRGKKVKEVLKSGVHKGQVRITTISKKIGHGVGRGRGRHGSLSLKRITSAPDFHQMLGQPPSQASSIHLRQYHSIHASQQDLGLLDLPPPPPAPSPEPAPQRHSSQRVKKDRRLLSDLWLMSAAIFRRLSKVEQARAAIQEAEVRDEDNPAVWVQLGLYYVALGEDQRAASAFQKALFIHQDDVPATIYLCRIYLTQAESASRDKTSPPNLENVDLAAGLLEDLTHGPGWDVAEAWYFLAKAYKLQERLDRERECLSFALSLAETRGVRDLTSAVGWCL